MSTGEAAIAIIAVFVVLPGMLTLFWRLMVMSLEEEKDR
jgi:hypothetical protein